MKKKTLYIAAPFAAVLLVAGLAAGCEDTGTTVVDNTQRTTVVESTHVAPSTTVEKPTTSGKPKPTSTTTSALSDDDVETLFLTVVRQEIPEAGAETVDLAKAICEGLDDGLTPRQVATALIEAGGPLSNDKKGTILGAAVPAFCPQHNDAMQAFFDEVE